MKQCGGYHFSDKGFDIGDTVYQYDSSGKIYASKITKIRCRMYLTDPMIYETDGVTFDQSAVGNSIFTSEKEAKQHYEEHYGR